MVQAKRGAGLTAASDTVGDDRVSRETRWTSLVVFCILVPALIVLWGMPDETADLWAWTIKPDLTPIFMGAGYGAGAYFFLQTWRAERWHPSSAGVFGAAFFASLMLIATLVHWDKFNHGDAPFLAAFCFYAWIIVYILSPFVVMWLWWRNHQHDPRTPEPRDPIVPEMIRLGARVFAVGALLGAAVLAAHAADRAGARQLHGAGGRGRAAAVDGRALELVEAAAPDLLRGDRPAADRGDPRVG